MTAHGTPRCYQLGCRRPECRAASTRAAKEYRLRTDYGTHPVRVDATPTRRYIEDLMSRGWSGQALADHLGIARKNLHGYRRAGKVDRSTAVRVRKMWGELAHRQPPRRNAREKQSVSRTLKYGAGFPPVLAFDNLADPAEKPKRPGPARQSRPSAETAAEVEHLRSFGLTDPVIAARLGVGLDGLQAALRRAA